MAPTQPIVRVTPGEGNPTHDLSLADATSTYGLNILGGLSGLQGIPQTASTLRFTGGGGKFGDYEPALSHIEQRTWQGGRGSDSFADDPSKYFDGHHVWTLTPNKILPGPEWLPARGLRTQNLLSRKRRDATSYYKFFWKQLYGTERGRASYFVAPSNITADKCYVFIRRIGNPGTLTFELRSDSSNSPGTVLQTVTVTTSTINDWEGVWYPFNWSGTQALVSGTGYWIDLVGASTDNASNHWLVGTTESTDRVSATDEYANSSEGSSWSPTASGFTILSNVVDADVKRVFKYFMLDGLLYAVSINADGSNSKLYVNGTRGKATSAAASLTDSNNSDPVDCGSYVYILRGTGKGQAAQISTANGTPAGTLALAAILDTNFGTDSEYIIYNTSLWKEITGHGLGVITDVVVCNNIAYFAQGTTTMRRMRFNYGAAPPAYEFATDGANVADLLAIAYKDTKPVIWKGIHSTSAVSRADGATWGTDLTFGTAIPVADTTWPLSKLIEYDDGLAVLKPDGVFLETADDKFERLPVDLDKLADISNGKAALAKDLFLYFNFAFSVEKYYSGTLSDIGPWRGTGLPTNRVGQIVDIEGGVGLIFIAIDGGTTNYSSVLATDGIGFCEIFRSPQTGERIRSIRWQPQPGTRPRLWVECNGDMVHLDFPYTTLNPANDANFLSAHECSLITSTFDMDSATLYKYFKEFAVSTRNIQKDLPYIGSVEIDYQLDDDIGLETAASWNRLDRILVSPYDTSFVNQGNRRAIRFRIRIYTANAVNVQTTPEILGTVLTGFARTPVKYQYIFRAKVSDYGLGLSGTPDVLVDDLLAWLIQCAFSAKRLTLRSRWKFMDDKTVVVEPPSIYPDGSGGAQTDAGQVAWSANLGVILREV
ncbi:hypothetical protein [Caudoviricetes sp.]|nr:hypothetical protein [Caudoviricetes sp.]UOF81092.1 hypothetical protein [Caudoviricetes sp.]UOF82227.1 hypothetical protein [Caudoviricetes sp.]UOF82437.1 hypothetical protein [Caudoviricetes sp.]UOF82636.1 hypothetical protein [Caudoviricetes sp.]